MNETQMSITEWSVEQFGETPPVTIAIRMNKEVAELLMLLHNLPDDPAKWTEEQHKKVAGEVADVGVMLSQVAETSHINLTHAINIKMSINRNRVWKRADDGSFQHDE